MTIIPGFLPRRLENFRRQGVPRLFPINEQNQLLGYCHWQNDKNAATVILLHGLEGSSESSHVLGIGYKSFRNNFNVLRLNMRTCGDSIDHSKSLYNAGLWQDVHAVMRTLCKEDGRHNFILVGYSLGGNLILNLSAHHEDSDGFKIQAVCAVSPSIDLARSVEELERPHNRIYQDWFLRGMKKKILAKSKQFPDTYDTKHLGRILTIREFDNCFTAPNGGYGTAERYYREASAHALIKDISTAVLIIAAEDDPLVPVESFRQIQADNPQVKLLITKHGGHGGFYQSQAESEPEFDHFWAENRVVAFIKEVSSKEADEDTT